MPTIPYAKQSWTDGSGGGTPISAARLAVLENGIYETSLAPAVRVYHNATQSLTTATETALAFNTELFDTCAGSADTQHDNAVNNSRLTCRYAGKYQVTGNVAFAANATGQRYIFFRVNGTASQHHAVTNAIGNGTYQSVLNATCLIDLAVNDYVQLFAYQDSGGALNAQAGSATDPYACQFMMFRAA